MKIKKYNKNHKKVQMVSQKQLAKKMSGRTDEEKELENFIKRLDANYKKKIKHFETMTGKIGRGVAHP